MTIDNEAAIREVVETVMSSLTVDELREFVMDPYREFARSKVLVAA